jgi:hypothetical protein
LKIVSGWRNATFLCACRGCLIRKMQLKTFRFRLKMKSNQYWRTNLKV